MCVGEDLRAYAAPLGRLRTVPGAQGADTRRWYAQGVHARGMHRACTWYAQGVAHPHAAERARTHAIAHWCAHVCDTWYARTPQRKDAHALAETGPQLDVLVQPELVLAR